MFGLLIGYGIIVIWKEVLLSSGFFSEKTDKVIIISQNVRDNVYAVS